MKNSHQNDTHSAADSALGYYYQTFFALLTLLTSSADNAAISVEQLDDVSLTVDGETLLFQLKHSLRKSPPRVTLSSASLWRTLKVWIDLLPAIALSETTLHLVTVSRLSTETDLNALTSSGAPREPLVDAMVTEAQRIADERAQAARSKKTKQLPHAQVADGCAAFLALSDTDRLNLMRRVLITQASPPITEIEQHIAARLTLIEPSHRGDIAKRLIEWWDRQVVYLLCNKRDKLIFRTELQQQITLLIGDLIHERLVADFESLSHPADYHPDGMLARQIELVDGRTSDLSRAIREEWRAREQRAKWLNEKPNMATAIDAYDRILAEHWNDRHAQMVEDCDTLTEAERCARGLLLLRWSHEQAPTIVRPIATGWEAPYYVRGSYQVLAINLKVGWHPHYKLRLESDE